MRRSEANQEPSRQTGWGFTRIVLTVGICLVVIGLICSFLFLSHTFRKETGGAQAKSGGEGEMVKQEEGGAPGLSLKQTAAYPKLIARVDFDHDGVDDYSDLVQGAHESASRHPKYDTSYYQGGYPPDDRGACTDEIWRAFRHAGYDLKAMIDADISTSPSAYASIIAKPDPNIDFRRANVLGIFLKRYGQQLTTDTSAHDQWQQGDIVIFDTSWHIGMVSDRRDGQGIPLLLHNMGQKERENDYLASSSHRPVTGHFRFDASQIPESKLIAWKD